MQQLVIDSDMKRFLLVLIVGVGSIFASHADKIVLKSAETIECKVSAIDDTTIKYRKEGEDFDREVPKDEVFKVKYDNGDEDFFGNAHAANHANNPVDVASETYKNVSTEPDWTSTPVSSRTYQIGDWYSENGVEGIVIWTTPDGKHGRIVNKGRFGVSMLKNPPAFFLGPTNVPIGMNDTTNGYANMLALKSFMRQNPQYTIDMFPVQQVIESLGNGWYLPSIKELEYFHRLRGMDVTYEGNNPEFKGKTVKWHKIFNSVSKKHGGDKHDCYYQLSSTEVFDEGKASVTHESLYGDPSTPQFALMKFENSSNSKPIVRNKGKIPFFAFHLF